MGHRGSGLIGATAIKLLRPFKRAFARVHRRLVLNEAERVATAGALSPTLKTLRKLSMPDFAALLYAMPLPRYPNLSRVLPRMASKEVQISWTGNHGHEMLVQTIAFVQLLTDGYSRFTGRDIAAARILDFGCGYGRLMRMLAYYADTSLIYGCDPWQDALDLCISDRVPGHLALSERVPQALPFAGRFDLICAYSVFTHLSERVTTRCFETLTDALAPGGLLVVTVRPIGYWSKVSHAQREEKIRDHQARGFAFAPHGWPPIDDDIPYGDTSLTPQWIERNIPRLRVADVIPLAADPNQVCVFLTAR